MTDIAATAAKMGAKEARSGARAARSVADAKETAYAKLARTAERWQGEAARSAERLAKLEARAAQHSANEQARASAQAAAKKERDYQKTAREAARWARQELAEIERSKKAEAKAAADAAKERERIAGQEARAGIRAMAAAHAEEKRQQAQATKAAEKEAARRNGIRERSATMAGRHAVREAREEARARREAERKDERRRNERRERIAGAIMGGGVAAGRHLVRGATALAQTTLALGGGFDVQSALHDKLNLDRNAVHFSNAAFQGREGETRLDTKAVQETTKANAIKTGTDASELLAASAAYGAKSGAYGEGLELQEFFGKVAKGTNAKAEDVAAMAGLLKVQNKDLKTGEMKALILNMVRQGQAGSVEASDLAKIAGKVTRTSASYAGDQGKTQGKLLGLSQVAMRTSGNANEAATVLSNISADALNHRDKVGAALGRDFLNAKGQIAKAPEEFLADVMSKTNGNLGKVADLGFGQRSMKMFQALAPVWNEAEKKALDSGASKPEARKAARDAVLKDMREMTDASMSVDELDQNVAKVLESSAEQFEQAVRLLKTEVSDTLLPALTPLVGVLRDLTPTIAKTLRYFVAMAEWAASNPLAAGIATLGASISAEVMKQIVSAKIGDLIKSLLGGGGGGGTPAGVLGGAGGKVGKAAAVVGAGVVAGELTKDWIDSAFGDEKKKRDQRSNDDLEATNLISAAAKGPLTEEQRKRAIELTQRKKADLEQLKKEADPTNAPLVKLVTGAVGNVVAPKETKEAQEAEQRANTEAIRQQNEILKALDRSVQANTAATTANTNNPGGAPAPGAGPYPTVPNNRRTTPQINR